MSRAFAHAVAIIAYGLIGIGGIFASLGVMLYYGAENNLGTGFYLGVAGLVVSFVVMIFGGIFMVGTDKA